MLLNDIATQARTMLRQHPPRMRGRLFFLILFTLFVGILEIGVAGLVSLLGIAVAAPQSILDFQAVQKVVEQFPQIAPFAGQPLYVLAFLLLCIVCGVAFKNILLGMLSYMQACYAASTTAHIVSRVFRSYISQDYVWHLGQNAAGLLGVMTYRSQLIAFLTHFLTFITQTLISLGMLAAGFYLAPLPMLIVFCVTGLTACVTYGLSKRAIRRNNERLADNIVDLNRHMMAGLQGIREVLVYQRSDVVTRIVEKKLHEVTRDNAMNSMLPSLSVWTLESMGMVTLFLALLLMLHLDYSPTQVTGTLALLAAMAWRLLPSANKVVSTVVRMQGTIPYLEKFAAALNALPEEQDRKQAMASLVFSNDITLEDVSFRYPEAAEDALANISLTVGKGEMIGIIGRSGAGKSTLVSLLTGLVEPSGGVIRIDGEALTGYDAPRIRGLIGFVPQSPCLIDGTLAENVAFSRLGEAIDEEAVLDACKLAALDFRDQLPEGIHTPIGDRGVRISGGQAQRVAIARALYAKPQILVFDEATSALDRAAEKAIQKTIEELSNNLTVIIVAHRLSTVEACDRLYWIEAGSIMKSGPPSLVLPAYVLFRQ